MKEIKITGDFIKLDQLLKLSGIAQTGGHGKIIISQGNVLLNDEIERQRGKKIKKGDIIEVVGIGKIKVV